MKTFSAIAKGMEVQRSREARKAQVVACMCCSSTRLRASRSTANGLAIIRWPWVKIPVHLHVGTNYSLHQCFFFVVYFSVFSHIRCAIEEPNRCFSSGLSACPLSRAKSLRHSEITRENISNFMTNFRYTKNQS